MKISLIAPLALLLIASPALASTETIAQKEKACVAPKDITSKAKAKLLADLSGDALAKFNENYVKITKHPAPDVDRILVYSIKDAPVVVMFAFKSGCAIGAVMIDANDFEKVKAGPADDGSI